MFKNCLLSFFGISKKFRFLNLLKFEKSQFSISFLFSKYSQIRKMFTISVNVCKFEKNVWFFKKNRTFKKCYQFKKMFTYAKHIFFLNFCPELQKRSHFQKMFIFSICVCFQVFFRIPKYIPIFQKLFTIQKTLCFFFQISEKCLTFFKIVHIFEKVRVSKQYSLLVISRLQFRKMFRSVLCCLIDTKDYQLQWLAMSVYQREVPCEGTCMTFFWSFHCCATLALAAGQPIQGSNLWGTCLAIFNDWA